MLSALESERGAIIALPSSPLVCGRRGTRRNLLRLGVVGWWRVFVLEPCVGRLVLHLRHRLIMNALPRPPTRRL
ncbi:hypothetical protein E2C01_048960 [Portunus trituberculatus]|uniref:Uncharacterized protein n=1 Tax=Portunus trituberculatus TaxID=210409 RepID=A0A5B7GBJ7_PORTR|nr:hypothetical protein [Portunus trituberculatus]